MELLLGLAGETLDRTVWGGREGGREGGGEEVGLVSLYVSLYLSLVAPSSEELSVCKEI